MKTFRILAIIPLGLISLMNVGYAFGTDPTPDFPAAAGAVALGLAGLVAGYGLARNASWGVPAALGVAGVNVVAASIALATDTEGAVIGLVVSAVALVLAAATVPARRVSIAGMPR